MTGSLHLGRPDAETSTGFTRREPDLQDDGRDKTVLRALLHMLHGEDEVGERGVLVERVLRAPKPVLVRDHVEDLVGRSHQSQEVGVFYAGVCMDEDGGGRAVADVAFGVAFGVEERVDNIERALGTLSCRAAPAQVP